jgi:tRNA-specific 2-thiouridylase
MKKNKKIAVAMSGGVDSSVTAVLLKKQGYDVIGISMQLWDYTQNDDSSFGNCCSLEDIYEARRIADTFGFPFYTVNLEKDFSRGVVDYFVTSYMQGETPNPCLKCNELLKFQILLRKVKELGFDYLATGHYAKIAYDKKRERYLLMRGKDRWKDQSYFLFTMTQAQLSRVLFPLGDFTKEEVRGMAKEWGLRVADKKDSQEICFIPENDYTDFISQQDIKDSPGDIVDQSGKVLGRHTGLFKYTIGQRKGMGIAAENPLYVLKIDTVNNRLIVGGKEELESTGLLADNLNWIGISSLDSSKEVESKIRYRHPGVKSKITPLEGNGKVEVHFSEQQGAVTPGQAVVFYNDDEVLGGGWIKAPL